MASYNLVITKSAAKELERVPGKDRRRVVERIGALAHNPGPPGCEKLSGEDKYRVRHGDYRILYEIVDDQLIVTVVRVGHRRDVSADDKRFLVSRPVGGLSMRADELIVVENFAEELKAKVKAKK